MRVFEAIFTMVYIFQILVFDNMLIDGMYNNLFYSRSIVHMGSRYFRFIKSFKHISGTLFVFRDLCKLFGELIVSSVVCR